MTTPRWTEAAVRLLVEQQFRDLLPDIDVRGGDNFFRLGGNSLAMLRLIAAFDGHGLTLTARDFVARPTPDGVVRSVMARLPEDG